MAEVLTPSQPLGPLWAFALLFDGCQDAVPAGGPEAIPVVGRLLDGQGAVCYPDALVEVWSPGQLARCQVDADGWFRVTVRRPRALHLAGGPVRAPCLHVTVFGRGLLKQVQTLLYFPDEPAANAGDPILSHVEPQRRHTLIARWEGEALRFDVRLQGEDETVFFAF